MKITRKTAVPAVQKSGSPLPADPPITSNPDGNQDYYGSLEGWNDTTPGGASTHINTSLPAGKAPDA
jgi:hypothetical protein